MKTDIAVIVQCRVSSKRLPGKALKTLAGRTVLEWTLNSMSKVKADRYFVATDKDSYEELKPIAEKCGWEIFVGPLEDVLERYCQLIEQIKCKYVLRATADNPFLFYEAAQALCDEFKKQMSISSCDYMTWLGLPHGSGVEIFKADSLLKAKTLTNDPFCKEHVAPAIYNNKNRFTSLFYKAPSRFYFPNYRTTIDTSSDYRRALAIINFLSDKIIDNEPLTTEQILLALKSPCVKDTILLVPCVKKGSGTGHLRRCLNIALDIGCFVYIPLDCDLEEASFIIEDFYKKGLKPYQIVNNFPEENEYSVIVTDSFVLSKDEYELLIKKAPVVSIDEGSIYTDYSEYLLDVIPSLDLNRIPNYSNINFIDKPINKKLEKITNNQIKKILITFGGEDPASLSIPVLEKLIDKDYEITVILSNNKIEEKYKKENVKFIDSIFNLKEELKNYDLIITHYGITAYESIFANCAVLLVATTKLHGLLAEKYGFECIYPNKIQEIDFDNLIKTSSKLFLKIYDDNNDNESLSNFVKTLSHGKKIVCPVCETKNLHDEVIYRTKTKTYRRCNSCGIIYLSWSIEKSVEYEKQYFESQYKAQYGRTYLEDFDSIKKSCIRRVMEINAISKVYNNVKPSVLDIGCAYGPYLSAANDYGWQVYGTDISKDAVDYVQNTLLFPAVCSDFPNFDSGQEFGINEFDAVTMWYVIEHFESLKEVLKTVNMILKKGGVFAFSTPSAEGVSAKYNKKSFYEKSPSDHFTLWEPKRVSKILKMFGFKLVKIVSTGHHPERFSYICNNGIKSTDLRYKTIDKISKTFKLGDTFEVYCKKI